MRCEEAIRKIKLSKRIERYRNDLAFRGNVTLCQNMTVNFLYAAFRVIAGACYASVWFVSIAVYYSVLGGLRAYLFVCYRHRSPALEYRCYRNTAWLLLLLNITMGGMIVQMVLTNSAFSYPGHIIYLSAAYTLYAVAAAVMNIIKYRRLGSPVMSAAKVLNLISAMMSVLGLQTAMISRFSVNAQEFRMVMNAAAGGVVYVGVIVIAVFMLLHGKRLGKEQREN